MNQEMVEKSHKLIKNETEIQNTIFPNEAEYAH